MVEIARFCPSCFGNEVVVKEPLIVGAGEGTARCSLCAWKGKPSEVFAAPVGGQWDSERVAQLVLYATTKYATAPLLSLFERLGLVPKLQGEGVERASAEAIRAEVARAVLEAVAVTGFETAARLSSAHYQRFDAEKGQEMARVFSLAEPADA